MRNRCALIRTFDSTVTGKGGLPLPQRNWRDGRGWSTFERLLLEVLWDRGYSVFVQPATPLRPDFDGEFTLRIKSHGNAVDHPDAHLHYMQMHFTELFSIDPRGWGADHSRVGAFDPDAAVAEDASAQLAHLEAHVASGGTKHRQRRRLALRSLRLPEQFVFCPLQTPRDYVIRQHADHSVVEFMRAAAALCTRAGEAIVFKVHPYARYDRAINLCLAELLLTHRNVFASSGDVTELVRGARGVITINSGVGMESIVAGRPVLAFGRNDYTDACFRIHDDVEAFFEQLRAPQSELAARTRAYLLWYLSEVGILVAPGFEDGARSRLDTIVATHESSS